MELEMSKMSKVEQVRLLISDVGGDSGTSFTFEDDQIQGFLDLQEGNVKRAAASALRTLAANEALVLKRITFLELSTDGGSVAKALVELADKLEQEAANATPIYIA
jgi:hypothetical protein